MAYIGNDPSNIQRGRRAQYRFTATASQTVFSGTDDDGQSLDLLEAVEADVYFNGSRLVLDDDYTISGDTLTLTAGAAAGDILVIVTQDDIVNLNSYTKSEADDRYINYTGDIVNGDIQVSGEVDAGSLIIDTDVLVVDATNNRVGIGTASPERALHVDSGSVDVNALFVSDTTVHLSMWDGTGGSKISNYSGEFAIQTGSNSNGSGGTERMRIDSSGNVGIGTSTVASTGTQTTLGVYAANYPTIKLNNSTTGVASTDGSEITLNSSSMDMIIRNRENADIAFYTNNTEHMSIDSSGQVSISHSAPGNPVTLTITNSDGVATVNNECRLHFANTGSAIHGSRIESVFEGIANTNHYTKLKFYTTGSNSAIGERLTIDGEGNVGIGTASPSTMMHLKDHTANDGPVIRLEGNSNNTAGNLLGGIESFNADPSGDGPNVVSAIKFLAHSDIDHGGQITFSTHDGTEGGEGSSPVERVRIDESGRVGIGTTSPSHTLTVENAGYIQANLKSSNSSGGLMFTPSSGDVYEIQANTSSEFFIYNRTDNQYVLQIDGSGRVTMPYQPAFRAHGNSSTTVGANYNELIFATVGFNIGGHYNNSTGRFTAPVSGTYFVEGHLVPTNTAQNSNAEFYIIVNNSYGTRFFLDRARKNESNTNSFSLTGSTLVYLNANDFIALATHTVTDSATIESSSHFSVCLMS